MILERKTRNSILDLKQQQGDFLERLNIIDLEDSKTNLLKFVELIQVYSGAMKEISTKLEVLDEEFNISNSHNPIHHLECRIKGLKSIYEKMLRYDVSLSLDSMRDNVKDIAGIRVICNFIDDIYIIEKLLLSQPDITLVSRKDYIENPKENGYRSLHLVVKVPVFLSNRTEDVPVEIQLRTIAMDYWASLEYMLRYKKNRDNIEQHSAALLDCANTLIETEKTMQQIRINIEKH